MNKELENLFKKFENIMDLSEEIVYFVQIMKIVHENATDDESACLIPLVDILRHKTVHLLDKTETFYQKLYKATENI